MSEREWMWERERRVENSQRERQRNKVMPNCKSCFSFRSNWMNP